MPRRSKHASHLLMIVSGTFAALLIMASIFVPKSKQTSTLSQSISGNIPASQIGPAENTPAGESISPDIQIDTTNWKTYRDPVYHFSIRYPENWAVPQAQKITDPDFNYEYQVSFGTSDTMAGDNFDGFNLYVFRTGKCDTSASQGNVQNSSSGESASSCATKISSSSLESANQGKILEFSSLAYTYTLVPFIAPDGVDPKLVKKINLEFNEAGKTFQYDSSLKIPAPPKPKLSAAPAKPVAPVGKRGTLTGAVSKGGKLVCPHPNSKPMRSPNKGNHVDEDCCPDPDEWPNVACAYKPSDYKIMLKL